MLVLQVIQGPDKGRRFELPDHEPQLIGRSTEALPITDMTVSRRHAELTPDDGRWFLRDLDSANGSFINGRSVRERTELSPGDQIRCGSSLFLITAVDAAETTARPGGIHFASDDELEVHVEATGVFRAGGAGGSGSDASRAPTAADHLRVIYDLTALTSGSFQREDLLQKIMDLIFAEFRCDRGFILLLSAPDDPPEPAAVRYRVPPRRVDEGRIPVSRTIIRHALEKGEGVLSTNAMNDDRFQAGDSVRDYGIRSAICVPIRAGARNLGVIHIDSQLATFTFTPGELDLLSAIGRHTALALSNLELIRHELQNERLAAVGEAVASLSHSIKNILQGLRGGGDAVELAINRNDLNLARQGWPILARNLDRIFHLTLNMLAYSKPRTLDLELASMTQLVQEVAELIRPQCEAKRAALVLELDEAMPPLPFDFNAMHQALMNVLTNAVEAIPSKTGVITIRTRFDEAEQVAEIIIADNGPGVPAAFRQRAFDPFTSTKGQRGTGLGLAVTKKIIDEHGGSITLEAPPGEGTMIILRLPLEQADLDAGATHHPRPLGLRRPEEIRREDEDEFE